MKQFTFRFDVVLLALGLYLFYSPAPTLAYWVTGAQLILSGFLILIMAMFLSIATKPSHINCSIKRVANAPQSNFGLFCEIVFMAGLLYREHYNYVVVTLISVFSAKLALYLFSRKIKSLIVQWH